MHSNMLNLSTKLKGTYKMLVEPSKIVSTSVWIDEEGNEDTTEYSVALSEMDGKTHMIFTQSGLNGMESRDGHSRGWLESFVKLSEILTQNKN